MRRRSGLALIAGGLAAFALGGRATPAPLPGLIGAYRWRMADPRFGGFSAIHIEPGGRRFTALSDRGTFTRGTLARDAAGCITGVTATRLQPLRGPGIRALPGGQSDSEGIALRPDGTAFVSFEGKGAARVLRYARLDGPAEELPVPDAFRRMEHNAALEALAAGPDGALYTLPERTGSAAGGFPVWRFRRGVWDQPFEIRRRGDFLPVAADVGPDGQFYLLERRFALPLGFASRIRRFSLMGQGVAQEATLLETSPGMHDNLEGLSVWRASGGLVATMLSDDNFRAFQTTEIVEYRLAG